MKEGKQFGLIDSTGQRAEHLPMDKWTEVVPRAMKRYTDRFGEQYLKNREKFLTPERMERLSGIGTKFVDRLRQRFGVERTVHNPELIIEDPSAIPSQELGAVVSDEPGAALVLMRNTQLIRKEADGMFTGKFDQNKVDAVYIHELAHLNSKIVWSETQTDSDKGALQAMSRLGLHFQRAGGDQWRWVNEALTEGYKQEEFQELTGEKDQNLTYPDETHNFQTIIEALAKNRGRNGADVRENFYGIMFGKHNLAKLRELIPSQFHSVQEFVDITDAPDKIFGSKDGKEIFKLLAGEFADGKTGTELQLILKHAAEESQEMMNQVSALRDNLKSLGTNNLDRVRLAQIVDGFDSVLQQFPYLTKVVNFHGEAMKLGYPDDLNRLKRCLDDATEYLPRAVFLKNNAESLGLDVKQATERMRDPEYLAYLLSHKSA